MNVSEKQFKCFIGEGTPGVVCMCTSCAFYSKFASYKSAYCKGYSFGDDFRWKYRKRLHSGVCYRIQAFLLIGNSDECVRESV